MEKNKQDIVPVTLQNNHKENRRGTQTLPNKLVARLKRNQTELLIYNGIDASTLKILLTEMSINETR
ncbi:hypothetical protein [Alkalibacterium gilvum]|uniref:hypothetical protein n=1 Tax=Alkalibacterium gilvum TaxID=1130080 RepID=UPI003F937EC7